MNGTKGFRARAAAASYQRRQRRLVSEDVRELRAANLSGPSFHGNPEDAAAAAVKPTQQQAARASAAALAAKEAAAVEVETEVTELVTDETNTPTEADLAAAAELAAAGLVAAEVAAFAEAAAAAAEKAAAEKAAADKAKGKHGKKGK